MIKVGLYLAWFLRSKWLVHVLSAAIVIVMLVTGLQLYALLFGMFWVLSLIDWHRNREFKWPNECKPKIEPIRITSKYGVIEFDGRMTAKAIDYIRAQIKRTENRIDRGKETTLILDKTARFIPIYKSDVWSALKRWLQLQYKNYESGEVYTIPESKYGAANMKCVLDKMIGLENDKSD